MKRKILFIFALLCAIAQGAWAQSYDVWDGHSEEEPRIWPSKGDYKTDYIIYVDNCAQLAYISKHWEDYGSEVNRQFMNCIIELRKNLDLTAGNWTPFGEYTYTFDGRDHIIKLKISDTSTNYQGLFKEIGSTGTVKNLHVDCNIVVGNARMVAGIAGENNGTIENCWVSGHIESDHYSEYDADLGGIAGINENDGKIKYCCVTADVKNTDGNSGVGGIAGSNEGTIQHVTFYGSVSVDHTQDNKYVGDQDATLENYYDSFNQSEYDAASGYDLYRGIIKYPYAINIEAVGYGTVQVSAGGETGITRWHHGETVTLTKTNIPLRSVSITDADGNEVSVGGNATSGFTFTMPKKDVTATVYYDYADWPTQGAGTEADPYLISSAEDWLFFANNVTVGRTYSGNYVKLTSDISVSTMAGDDEDISFQGTFDGGGHTMTLNLNERYRSIAPFRYVKNATIKNLKTAGSVKGNYTRNQDAMDLSGIAGWAYGTTTIENCVSSAALTSDRPGDIDACGIVAHVNENQTINLKGCVFNGSITYSDASGYEGGGLIGWLRTGATANVKDCLFAPSAISISNTSSHYTLTGGTSDAVAAATITRCYYTKPLGTAQGTLCIAAATIPANLGSPTAEYGTLTAYPTGLLFNGTFYGGFTTFSLTDTGDNTATITSNDGYLANVTLQGRTLYRDGAWNTLCLPFDVPLSSSPLAGAVARPLTSASISESTLNLTFGNAVTTLVAGTPYIIKWTSSLVTGLTAISGTGTGDEGYDKLFDGNLYTKWCQSNGPWTCEFNTSAPVGATGYTLTTATDTPTYPDRNPQKWTLEARANESDAWTTIDSRDVTANSGDALPTTKRTVSQVYNIAAGNQGHYQYFRFTVSQTGGSLMQLSELNLYGNIASPTFSGVTVDATDNSYDNLASGNQRVRFIGTYDKKSFTEENRSILFMGSGNTLYYPLDGATINAHRAYFKIGDDNSDPANAAARLTAFNINFGDSEATGIISLTPDPSPKGEGSEYWYTLDGRRLAAQPSRAGVYIYKGIKRVIK